MFAEEHKPVDFSDEHQQWLNDQKPKRSQQELLGLHKTADGFAPGNFIGAVWIGEGDNKTPLIVNSKFEGMDYLSMYLQCAEDPIIQNHLGGCFYFWPDETPIETGISYELDELLIATFLRELNELCLRHLRKHFEKETANLTGKVKGKILMHQQVKRNLIHGRSDKVFCSYQTIKQDIPENRILRAALEQSAKFINARANTKQYRTLHHWIHSCRAALSGVPSIEVKKSDFRNLRVRGAFAHYQRPIGLAKFILSRKGTNPRAEVQDNTSTPPFAINSAELFERYAEKILREKYPRLEARYNRKNIYGDDDGFNITVRPDFFVRKDSGKEAIILDAKYRNKFEIEAANINEREETQAPVTLQKPNRDAIYQMVAYSRHKNLLEELGCKDDRNLQLILVYPNTEHDQEDDIEEKKTDNSFEVPLSMHFIKCPTIS